MVEGANGEPESAGARLARARGRLGLSIAQVAERLRLDERTVSALEADNYQAIGAAVFVRGFLRRYAELVGESLAAIEAMYAQGPHAEAKPDLAKTGMHRIESDAHARKLGVAPALIAAAGLAIAGALWWAMRAQPQIDSVVSEEQAQVLHIGTTGAGPGVTPRALDIAPAATALNETASATSQRRRLQLVFNGECWTEIYDALGSRLFSGFGHAGTTQMLSGVAPFRLVLGNVQAVAVAIEGTPVSLPTAAPGARLRLSLNGNGAVASAR